MSYRQNGVIGLSSASTASGVLGTNTSGGAGIGVAGRISPAGSGTAVYGDNTSGSGWAGFFTGRVFAQSGFTSSDARLKKDIKDTSYGLNEVLKLRAVSFKWKTGDNNDTQIGLIAQEVQKVIPEVVNRDTTHHANIPDGTLSLNYVALVPVLAKAIQEQQKLIEQQNARLSALERDRAPKTASLLGGGSGTAFALGLLPLGLVIAARRRKQRGG